MSTEATEKHQLRFRRADWTRIRELAARDGVECNELVRRTVQEYDERTRRGPLPVVALARPLSTGELILCHIVVANGDEEKARIDMRATKEEWHGAIRLIPGLRKEIDRKRRMIHV